MTLPSETLDRLTGTFCADRQFFDDLMAQSCGEAFVEMSVWYIWLQDYLHDIQNSLHEAGEKYGVEYQTWVVSMLGGAAHCLGMLMYLVARGVINEAAASGRRVLEYLGMAAHLVGDPSKAQFLSNAETKSPEFKRAFIRGDRDEAERLKRDGIGFRFAGMTKPMAKTATQLYDLFSRFNVHGGTMSRVCFNCANAPLLRFSQQVHQTGRGQLGAHQTNHGNNRHRVGQYGWNTRHPNQANQPSQCLRAGMA